MKFWLLIVFVYSPGGVVIDRYTTDFDTREECINAREVLNYKIGPLSEKVKTKCIQIKEMI
jgi:hypothetical protein